jgi:hypothetical protein
MPNSLIFKGERPSHLELYIREKPNFFDAIQLSTKAHHLSSNQSYHSIPLHQSHVSIYIHESCSKFNCQQQSLQLIEGEKLLTADDAYDIFTNFAIMEDNKVAFLMVSGRRGIRKGEKKDPKVLTASKRLEK